jgi:hypothetical protein
VTSATSPARPSACYCLSPEADSLSDTVSAVIVGFFSDDVAAAEELIGHGARPFGQQSVQSERLRHMRCWVTHVDLLALECLLLSAGG